MNITNSQTGNSKPIVDSTSLHTYVYVANAYAKLCMQLIVAGYHGDRCGCPYEHLFTLIPCIFITFIGGRGQVLTLHVQAITVLTSSVVWSSLL